MDGSKQQPMTTAGLDLGDKYSYLCLIDSQSGELLEECGHEVLVANARKLRLIYANKRKTDEIDAENLARLARLDPKLLYPVRHRGEGSQAHLALIRSRQALIGCRTQLVNPGYEGRSSPSGPACPSARPGASTTRRPSTYPRPSGRPSNPPWNRSLRSPSVSANTTGCLWRSPRSTTRRPSCCARWR